MSNVTTNVGAGARARIADRYGPGALLTWANAISFVRLLGVPFLVVVLVRQPVSWAVLGFAFVLAASDGIDGILARRQGTTRSGAFLDPLADKALVLGCLYALVAADRLWWLPVGLITVRELAISAYRMYWGRRGLAVPARRSAKVKTFVQELAVGLAIAPLTAGHPLLAVTVLWVAVVFTALTGFQYLADGRSAATAMTRARA